MDSEEPKKKINSRNKGASFERKLAGILRSRGYEARRGQQFSGGSDSPDVVHSMEGIHIEAKAVERLNIYEAMEQSERDAECSNKTPTVWHKKNHKRILVTMYYEDFIELYEKGISNSF